MVRCEVWDDSEPLGIGTQADQEAGSGREVASLLRGRADGSIAKFE